MAPTFVQKAGDHAQATASPLVFGAALGAGPVTNGNALIVIVQVSSAIACALFAGGTTASVTDSAGNTYQPICGAFGNTAYSSPCENGIANHAGGGVFAFIAYDVVGGSLTWTVTCSVGSGSAGGLGPNYDLAAIVVEYSGIPNYGIDAGSAIANNAFGVNPAATGYIETSTSETLVLAFSGMRASAGGVPSFQPGWDVVATGNHDIGADEFASIGLAGGIAHHVGVFGGSVTLHGSLLAPTSAGVFAIRLAPTGQTVPGYLIGRPAGAASILQPLAKAYFFDMVESDGLLKAVPRGGSSVMTIPEDDLGIDSDKAKLTDDQIIQEQDLPREVQVIYSDPAQDYQQNKQSKRRNSAVVKTLQQMIVQLPMALTADTAAQIAEKLQFLAYLERKQYGWSNWKAIYQLLDPTDVVQFVYGGATYQARLLKTSNGAGFVVQMSAVSEDSDQYTNSPSTVGGTTSGFQPGTAEAEVPTSFWLFDIPLLRDSDANPGGMGIYFAMFGSTGWPGGILYESPDDTTADFAVESSTGIPATVGTATGTLGAPSSPWSWDTVNSLTITIDGDFVSSTEAALLAGTGNALLVGAEVLQFRDALDNGDGTWTFSHLLRGRRGTDWACGVHGASETVVSLTSGALKHVALANAVIGVIRYYRGVTSGGDVSAVSSKTITPAAVELKPYSPVQVGGTADGDGNITILWTRRTRYGGAYGSGSAALIDGIGGPVNEEVEKFEIDILGGSPETVLRTITAYTNNCIYSAAQQVADFGSVQSTVDIKVYQISAAVGRGYEAAATVPVATDATAESTEPGGGFYIDGA